MGRMSQLITKEMWEDIAAEMSGSWVDIAFSYKGHKVSVNRVRKSESKTCLQVYIDGHIKGEWLLISAENCISDKAPAILADVWCKESKSIYKPSHKAQVIKIWGKREAKKRYPDIDEKMVFLVPSFSKASVLCRQFKKLEGMTLVKANFLNPIEEVL
jgi:hypothetical protein